MVSKPGELLHVEQIGGAVTSAGFTPRDMTATAVGSLSSHDENVVLRWEDSTLNFADGTRNLLQIRDAVAAEYGPAPLDELEEYFRLLESVGVVELRQRD